MFVTMVLWCFPPYTWSVLCTVTEFYSGFRLLSSRMVRFVVLLIVVLLLTSLRVVCISLREYHVVVSYTLMRCSLQPTLSPLVCFNVNDSETLLMDVVLWCVHSVTNGVTSGCSVNFGWQRFFSSCLLWLVHFIILYISLRVLCGCFIGSIVMLQA